MRIADQAVQKNTVLEWDEILELSQSDSPLHRKEALQMARVLAARFLEQRGVSTSEGRITDAFRAAVERRHIDREKLAGALQALKIRNRLTYYRDSVSREDISRAVHALYDACVVSPPIDVDALSGDAATASKHVLQEVMAEAQYDAETAAAIQVMLRLLLLGGVVAVLEETLNVASGFFVLLLFVAAGVALVVVDRSTPAKKPSAGAVPPLESEVRDTTSGAVAAQAYRDSCTAFNARDYEAYFATFTDPLDCFYNVKNVHIRERRRAPFMAYLKLDRVVILDETPEYVVLRAWHEWDGHQVEKTVALRFREGRWRIASEVDSKHNLCFPKNH
jgi:hypothetical protein